MSDKIIEFYSNDSHRKQMKKNAVIRANEYQAEPIMHQFMTDLNLEIPVTYNSSKTVA